VLVGKLLIVSNVCWGTNRIVLADFMQTAAKLISYIPYFFVVIEDALSNF